MMIKKIKQQKGMTLMELLVAGFISIIASSGMIILMANTLGTGARTIKATRLGDEMRSSMQFITRELRRANYHASFAACFGNSNCTTTLGIDGYINSFSDPVTGLADLTKGIGITATNDCLWFWYDRNSDKNLINEPVGAFRRATNDDGVGDVISWDITALVNGWINGEFPNHGLFVRDVFLPSTFRQVWFGSRDGLLRDYTDPRVKPGPRLVLELE